MKKKVFSLFAMAMFTFSLLSADSNEINAISCDDPFEDCYSEAVDFAVVLINLGASDEVFEQLTNMTYDVCIEEYFSIDSL